MIDLGRQCPAASFPLVNASKSEIAARTRACALDSRRCRAGIHFATAIAAASISSITAGISSTSTSRRCRRRGEACDRSTSTSELAAFAQLTVASRCATSSWHRGRKSISGLITLPTVLKAGRGSSLGWQFGSPNSVRDRMWLARAREPDVVRRLLAIDADVAKGIAAGLNCPRPARAAVRSSDDAAGPDVAQRERRSRCAPDQTLKHRRIAFIVRQRESRPPVHQVEEHSHVVFDVAGVTSNFSRSASTRYRPFSTRPRHLRLPRRSIRLSCSIRDWRRTCFPWSVRFRLQPTWPRSERRASPASSRPAMRRSHHRGAQGTARQSGCLCKVARSEASRRGRRSSDHVSAWPDQQRADARATTTSTTSCCRTYISTSPPPTRSCVIAVWRSESRISSVRSP